MERAVRSTATGVLNLSAEEQLRVLIAAHLGRTPGAKPSSEERSWEVSLPWIARDLRDAGLEQVEMLIEYQLPGASSRADVILSGVHPATGEDNYVVVELKQWSAAERAWHSDRIVRAFGMRGELLHPIDQVRGYCQYLTQYVEILHNRPQAVHGVAYLHNATENSISGLRARSADRQGRLFTGEGRDDFLEYLRTQLASVPGRTAADRLLNSPIRERSSLFSFTAAELRSATEYTLLDNQQVAYERVIDRVRQSHREDHKSVIVVTGGPGSGKSLIAVTLLAELHREGKRVQHATGSSAYTQSLRKFPAKGSTELKGLFQFYRTFAEYPKNDLDVLICDEAHRIREVSTNRYTKKASRTDRPQIDELISVARVPVFLLDEHQVVRPGEVGTVDEIRSHAARSGCPVFEIELDGIFRCGGSAVYDEWVRRLLGLRVGGPTRWTGDPNFEVQVAHSPQEMVELLRVRHEAGESARISAGYCWPWSQPNVDGSLVPDVRIGSWSMPWNSRAERKVQDVPPSIYWATDPGGFGQIGCIYTAQGFEFDWAGVIFGPDLVVDQGRLTVNRSGNVDPALKSTKNKPIFDDDFARLIRNTYKVLLTRGMRGVVLYAVDPATQEFLIDLVGPHAVGASG
ncbi:DUF2075 domain-containing protein [Nocardia stercoris]|uniref:DUF2075 domain-containing protein n=1 Tax=Nocardia stercoris TaxID=2483361 RepID=A0A3M2KWN9_9NOCA|nr:DUF2075 domain-containing protein [Nocardia stercoris]